jgi:HEAT repeat protein
MGRRRLRILLFLLPFFAVMGYNTFCQQPNFSTLSHDGHFDSIEQRLQKHNIPLTRTGLLVALHEGDFEIRWLAAYELLRKYQADSIPDVSAALASEKNPLTRESMADMLAQAGVAEGIAALKSMCGDPNLYGYWRVKAADDLLRLQDQSCLSSVVSVIQDEVHDANGSFALEYSLSLAPRFKDLPVEDAHKLMAAAAQALSHSDLLIRLAAIRTFGEMGDPQAIPYLEKALLAESNLQATSELNANIEKLRPKK